MERRSEQERAHCGALCACQLPPLTLCLLYLQYLVTQGAEPVIHLDRIQSDPFASHLMASGRFIVAVLNMRWFQSLPDLRDPENKNFLRIRCEILSKVACLS